MNTRDPSPLPLRVRLPFASEEEFIRRFGSNLSPSGIFIPTKALKPEGTQLRFELVLNDGTRLLRGGVVVQRALEASPTQRGGMELAFTELDGPSHAVLERVLLARDVAPAPMVSVGHLLSGRMQTAAPKPSPAGGPASVEPASREQNDAPAAPAADPSHPPSTHAPTPPDDGGLAHAGPTGTLIPEGHVVRQPDTTLAEEAAALARAAALAEEAAALAALGGSGNAPAVVGMPPVEHAAQAPGAPTEGVPGRDDAPARASTPADSALAAPGVTGAPRADGPTSDPLGQQETPPARAEEPEPLGATRERIVSEQQRSARAERIEGLARASAQGVGALVSRARQQEAIGVVSFSFDHPEAGIGRLDGGRYRHLPLADELRRSPTLRLLARHADAPRVLEFAGVMGLQPGEGDDGYADWDDGLGRRDGTHRAAHWLESVAAQADALTPGETRRPVLALPLHAGHLQRELWHVAARRVGLEQLQLVSSPIAAAIAYAQGKGFARRRMLVLSLSDLGFDAAVVQITGDDVEALSAAGDPFVGNAEFDARMLFGIRQTLRMRGFVAPELTSPEGRALMDACASARRELDQDDHALFEFSAVSADGARTPITFEYTRAEADAPVHDLVQRIVALIREVLDDAKLSAAGVDGVLMLGHTAHSPLLRQRLSALLERPVGDADEQPTSLIAQGAALFGEAQLRSEIGRSHLQLSEVLPIPLAIAERSGALRVVLDRGTRLPVSKTLAVASTPGVPLAIVAYQGGPGRADADLLGAAVCTAEMPGELEVRFRVGRDGRVRVELLPPGGGSTSLDRERRSAAQLEALLQHAPEGEPPAPDNGGLLVGIRRLFRKA